MLIRGNGPLSLINFRHGHRSPPLHIDEMTLGRAIDAYLATLRGAEQANTRRAYGQVLRRLTAEFGRETAPDSITAERFAA
jgi:hypothetical protein